MSQQSVGRLNLQIRTQLGGVEKVLVAGDFDERLFVEWPGINDVDHSQDLRIELFLNLDLGIEVPARLQVVKQVVLALVQQIVIDGIFFVDGNFPFQCPVPDVETFGGD